MEYIRLEKKSLGSRTFDAWDHTPYWEYLDGARHLMTPEIYEFASNEENHNLSSPNSLHDAWLNYCKISDSRETEDKTRRLTNVELSLFGPMHDRNIYLIYKHVRHYEFKGAAHLPSDKAWHGDLLIHELRHSGEDSFTHELLFATGAIFLIQFEKLEHRIEML